MQETGAILSDDKVSELFPCKNSFTCLAKWCEIYSNIFTQVMVDSNFYFDMSIARQLLEVEDFLSLWLKDVFFKFQNLHSLYSSFIKQ